MIGGMYMDFRRIDEETVQCILSEEEVNAYGFQIEDFFTDKDKAREFLEHLVEVAQEEIGYEAKSGMVSMQMMKMPNNDLVITLSDRDPGALFQTMLEHLRQQIAGMMEQDEIDDEEDMEELHNLVEASGKALPFSDEAAAGKEVVSEQEYQEHLREVARRKEEKIRAQEIAPRVYRFESYQALAQFAVSVSLEKPINSAVFVDSQEGMYYLLLKKGRLKREEYVQLCEKLDEFAVLYSFKPYVEQFCEEHFERFIPKQAIRILKEIETGKK
jgi:adapter protein MecA 1/2